DESFTPYSRSAHSYISRSFSPVVVTLCTTTHFSFVAKRKPSQSFQTISFKKVLSTSPRERIPPRRWVSKISSGMEEPQDVVVKHKHNQSENDKNPNALNSLLNFKRQRFSVCPFYHLKKNRAPIEGWQR